MPEDISNQYNTTGNLSDSISVLRRMLEDSSIYWSDVDYPLTASAVAISDFVGSCGRSDNESSDKSDYGTNEIRDGNMNGMVKCFRRNGENLVNMKLNLKIEQ